MILSRVNKIESNSEINFFNFIYDGCQKTMNNSWLSHLYNLLDIVIIEKLIKIKIKTFYTCP